MKKLLVGIAGASVLALSSAALAGGMDTYDGKAANDVYNYSGFYLGAGAGYGLTDTENFPGIHRDGFAFNVDGGYRFNRYVAAEAGYLYFPRVKIDFDDVNSTVHSSAVYIAGKGILPINDSFDVFAKAGAGLTFTSASADASGLTITASSHQHPIIPIYGVGADYNINQNLAITVQGIGTIGVQDFPSTYMGTAGLTYTF